MEIGIPGRGSPKTYGLMTSAMLSLGNVLVSTVKVRPGQERGEGG